MPNWTEILDEINKAGSSHDLVRRRYLKSLFEITGRNVIAYYSGWLQKPGTTYSSINDSDKNGFMTVVHKLDRSKGLDLILHTPGGELAATESIVDYLRKMFNCDIRAIIPQIAMSAGTMIACACNQILMGKHSNLGPIDPQFNGLPAHGIIEEFARAYEEIKKDTMKAVVWNPIIQKYNPTLIGECEKSIKWSKQIVKDWLSECMLKNDKNQTKKLEKILYELGEHAVTLSHSRHISAEKCKEIGLNIFMIEEDNDLQDIILSIHHACILTLTRTNAIKIIENHNGQAFIQGLNPAQSL